jgi:hypothetical protein
MLTLLQWDIAPLGVGYTIKLHGTDQYCTLQAGTGNGAQISLSTVPAAWRIVNIASPLHANEGYVQ